MLIHGKNHIGHSLSATGTIRFRAFYPATGEMSPHEFIQTTPEETEQALSLAGAAFPVYSSLPASAKAKFLRAIAEEIEKSAEAIIAEAVKESGLPEARIRAEKGRTTGQLLMFARLLEQGYGTEAAIETALPERTPAPRPDLRRMRKGIGPVVIFTASNFPLAFSTAGGDTASALAAGCPVIIKCHESHPGTNALVSDAIIKAALLTGMPDGVFSSLQGLGNDLGSQLVMDPGVKAVAFTGSFHGGNALYRMASQREEPIPVFAEMGSINPVFILRNQLKDQYNTIAEQMAQSITMGAGQFCTNPGLMIVEEDETLSPFLQKLCEKIDATAEQVMLNKKIHAKYESEISELETSADVEFLNVSRDSKPMRGQSRLAKVNAQRFLENPGLHREIFGPFSLCVTCSSAEEMELVALELDGQLTSSLWISSGDEVNARNLLTILEDKAGRIIINQIPTGVEVGIAMHHGGPFPATTDSRFTSVGADGMKRFSRPICYQNFPDNLLPDELKRGNPLKLNRNVNGLHTYDPA